MFKPSTVYYTMDSCPGQRFLSFYQMINKDFKACDKECNFEKAIYLSTLVLDYRRRENSGEYGLAGSVITPVYGEVVCI